MADSESRNTPVLLTGATGYVGGLLLRRLEAAQVSVRCLARNPDKLGAVADTTTIVRGDVLDADSLTNTMHGVSTAYYLVHSMGTAPDFEDSDRTSANNFAAAAKQAGVQRIIYLGGLGDDNDPNLSPHLRSRHEVGRLLRNSGIKTLEFRASAILGAGSLSFEMIRKLTNRLPIMICPRWLATPTQPIAISDLLDYLIEALHIPLTESQVFEIGGCDVVTYGELILQYAKQNGLKRWLIPVPVLTPYLSGLWLKLVTPTIAEVGRHLIEGLRNPTIVNDLSAQEAFAVRPMGTRLAIQAALSSTPTDR